MAIAKVQYKENASATPEVWMDTTQKTVTAGTMLSGTTALKNDGTGITGNIASKSSSDLTASGATVTAPAGYYPNSASKSVATTTHPNPTASINATTGVVTASHTQTAGYVVAGTTTGTLPLTTQAAKTVAPTESEQTAVSAGVYTTGAVKVGAISSTYVGSDVAQNDSSDLTASGATVTAPAGFYAESASKTVPSGTAGTPTASKGTVSNHSVSITPSVTNTTGYITGGTKNGTAVSVSASELVSGTKSITENGTGIDVTNFAAVDVSVSGGGGTTPASPKDVNFIDYDGTIIYSYTKSEFAQLYALPSNPDHSGDEIPLTSQGWNLTLAQINAQLTAQPNDPVTVGQMYVTTDGKTYIQIELHEGRLSPYLGIAVNGTVAVDWGDNTATSTVTGTSLTTQIRTLHEYAAAGRYTISISVSSGRFAFYVTSAYFLLNKNSSTANQNRVYSNAVQSVRIGNNASIGSYAFSYCYSLASLTIPSGVTSIGSYAFSYCYSLASLTIPSEVTSIEGSAFYYCYSLASLTIPSGVTSIGGSAFYYCYSLASLTIPSGVTSIGGSAFYYCASLASLTIPSGVTSISSSAFSFCCGLAKLRFLPTTPPTVANSSVFSNIPTDCVISVPTGSLSAYTSATNYPSSSTYTYIEE